MLLKELGILSGASTLHNPGKLLCSKNIEQKPLELAENYRQTVSHLHQVFAEYYNPHWNPHYYTGLYCALGLYKSEKIKNDKVKKMAVIQAVEYFADNVL